MAMTVPITVEPLELEDLTTTAVDGTGAFDTLMRANKAHLDQEFKQGRIKGPEYAEVYLGSLQAVMATALQFLIQGPKAALEAKMLEVQIEVAQVQLEVARLGLLKVPAEIALLEKQALQVEAQTQLINQQVLNAVLEGKVLVAQECKLRAEFDLTTANTTKTNGEISLLAQKTATEKAQTTAMGVDEDSVVGRQKGLYAAQTSGFTRDAEQKATKLLIDTWNVRRTTDEGTVADGVNQLGDATIGRAVTKLLAGIGA